MSDGRERRRHVALLVEDDAATAAEVRDLLRSLGHDCVHVETTEDGIRAAEAGGVCFVLLDLHIKASAEALQPRVESGRTLLEEIRRRYPGRTPNDEHALPILITSGQVTDHDGVVEFLKNGADDYLLKPFSENRRSLGDCVRDALRRSGRERHEDCAAATETARDHGRRAVHQPAGGRPAVRLALTGPEEGQRTRITIDGRPVSVRNGSFVLLLKLVVARVRGGEGWARKDDLGARPEQGWKGMSRLRADLRPHLPPGVAFDESDRRGHFRLTDSIALAEIDFDALLRHSDARVRQLARDLTEIRRRQTDAQKHTQPRWHPPDADAPAP
jgi:DNA-binding response OmpR family regulator